MGERRRKIVDWLVEFSTEGDVGDEGGQTLDVTGVEFCRISSNLEMKKDEVQESYQDERQLFAPHLEYCLLQVLALRRSLLG